MRTRSGILPKKTWHQQDIRGDAHIYPLPLEDASTPEGFDYSMHVPSVALFDLFGIEWLDLEDIYKGTHKFKWETTFINYTMINIARFHRR